MRGTSTTTRGTTATSTRTITKLPSNRALASRVAVLLVGWTLFLFAHSYRWTAVPLVGGIALFALIQPPALAFGARRAARLFDSALLATLAGIALQLVPLPAGMRGRVAPAAGAFDQAMRFGGAAGTARPLTIDPVATAFALVVAAAIAIFFWSLRGAFQRGGIRSLVRALVWIGLAIGPLAIVQHLMPVPIADAMWGQPAEGIRPYGPFVNRNDFAAWLIMALPLTVGYAVARTESRHRSDAPAEDVHHVQYVESAFSRIFDSTTAWLAVAICLMLAGLLASVSRSGLLGACAGIVFFAWSSRRRLTAARSAWAAMGLAATLAVALLFADVSILTSRLESSLSEGFSGRLEIWRQTVPIIRDFWPLGSGVGTFQTVMIPYQTMSPFFYITHADNEFLQILAEGGLLVGLPAAAALLSGVALAARRLRKDRTAVFWMRLGATAGLLSIGVQNMVEMTLRVPANAVLFAILAALALHEGSSPALSESTPARHEGSR